MAGRRELNVKQKVGGLAPSPAVWLALLVVASVVGRIAAARTLDAPWIAPDEFVYSITGRTFWSTGSFSLFGSDAPFYGIYPFLTGLPIALFGSVTGLQLMQIAQAVVASLTIVIVYGWARQMVGHGWALASALMTAALPALAYTGLLMTEPFFLPTATLALWMTARAIANPSLRRQLIALGAALLATTIRVQGVVFAPTLILALLLALACTRSPRLVRQFGPSVVAVVIGAAMALILRATGSGNPIGAYETATRSGYTLDAAAEWIGWHLVDVAILVCVFPLFALFMLLVESIRQREKDPDTVALVSVAASYLVASVALVGVFASANVGQLAERDLISLAPPLFIAFSVWLARGMPRPRPLSTVISFSLASLAAFLPVQQIITRSSTPDALMLVPLLKLREATSIGILKVSWPLMIAFLVALVLLVPRRGATGLAVAVIIGLLTASVFAQIEIDRRTAADRQTFFGTADPNWIDRRVSGRVTYLYTNDRYWNRVWQTVYWNSAVSSVVALSAQRSFGPIPGAANADLLEDGTLVRNGQRMTASFMVAPTNIGLAGATIASAGGESELGLTLWKVSKPTQITYRITGLPAAGVTRNRVTVEVFQCDGGQLEATISGRRPGTMVNISVDSGASFTLRVPAGGGLKTRIPIPHLSGSRRMCFVKFDPRGRIRLGMIRRLAAPGRPTHPTPVSSIPVVSPDQSRVGYCIGGRFINLSFRQPEFERSLHGAVVANYIQGRGLVCDDPPSRFVRKGLAPSSLGVPGDVYPYYVPADPGRNNR